MTDAVPSSDDDLSAQIEADRELGRSAAVRAFFGPAYDVVAEFTSALEREGELRGLIGPREVPRLWERHILNSAALAQHMDGARSIADVGSGAGLPGIVLAAMLPDCAVRLVEPMERRCDWLTESADQLGLSNVEVMRGRAEEYHDAWTVDVVTARAVASLDKLARWCLPLVAPGGAMVVLKGRNVEREIPGALKVTRRFGAGAPSVVEGATVDGVESTTVVRILVPA
ncbi:16S rRNA (guanine(527)-N(7))-methyltransferase RsmG [Paraoerskovia sediminicola]|nr:16S rRNA (guanine(527)-N(7))-methyltransferase RsmG [Paraoerskovia sediminicola]